MDGFDNKKKRICVLHHVNSLGGGTKSFVDLIMMLKDEYDIVACIPAGDSPLKNILVEQNIQILEINIPYPQYPRYSGGPNLISRTMLKTLGNLKHIKTFCGFVEKEKPEMVIFNSIVTIVMAPFLDKNIKKLCFVRETIVAKDARVLFKSIIKKYLDGACFLSQYDKQILSDDSLNGIVIPDSVPLNEVFLCPKYDARIKEGIDQDDFVVLYMGGDDRIKGIDTILKAFKYVGEGKKLLIAGRFEENSYKSMRLWNINEIISGCRRKKHYTELKAQGKVILVGVRRDISSIMNACDVVVFPSVKVHQPRPCIEAGFYHKPVIISNFKHTREYFIDGYNALVFKSKNERELAKQIIYACENPEKMELIGKNNYEMSIKCHNYEDIQSSLRKFIAEKMIR